MSVVIAIIENGVVYMGADTQTTAGKLAYRIQAPVEYKIQRLENGILAGLCGSKSVAQQLVAQIDIFTLDENGSLTRAHIAKNIVPAVEKVLKQRDKDMEASASVLLAYKDKMFVINSSADVFKYNEYTAIGSGSVYTHYALFDKKDLPVRERMLFALNASASRSDSVSAPFTLIDTQNMEFETVNEKGEKLC